MLRKIINKVKLINDIISLKQRMLLATGNVSYFGEFGWELTSVIPYAYWLHLNQQLRTTESTKDTKPLYYFSKEHKEKNISRSFVIPHAFPVHNVHVANLNTLKWAPPPYKSVYRNKRFIWSKPLCIISNKYTTEWGGTPVNYICTDTLRTLLKMLVAKYQVVYNRPAGKQIVSDNSTVMQLKEFDMIQNEFPDVKLMGDVWRDNMDLSFNELQLMIYANCDHFISVQGGSSVFASYFGGTNIVFAKKGREVEVNAYAWHNKFSGCEVIAHNNYDELIEEVGKQYK